jgi:hypothetical protein
MLFLEHTNDFRNLEEEDEEDEEAGIDDALLGELDDDGLIDEELDPLLKATLDPLAVPVEETEDEPEKEDDLKIFGDDDDEEEDVEYDSFDDHDEL